MKQGTFAWAMEQLLAGKKVARAGWDNKDFCFALNQEGGVICLDKLRTCSVDLLDIDELVADDWIVWHPPVNYIPGTFPWALEMMRRGNVVSLLGLNFAIKDEKLQAFGDGHWYLAPLYSHQILSTNWKVVE